MFWFLLTLWVLILGIAGGVLLKKRFPRLGWSLVGLMAALAIAISTGTAVCWTAPDDPDAEADYALLLGCGLEEGQATKELIRRCETALRWMEENPGHYLVVSGGDPGGHGITEAAVMSAWLRNHGADPDRLLTEDQANDTRQNLLYSKALAHEQGLETDTVLIITSEYHQTRAKFLAEQNGQQALRLSCRTPLPDHLFAAVREVYSFVKAVVETI